MYEVYILCWSMMALFMTVSVMCVCRKHICHTWYAVNWNYSSMEMRSSSHCYPLLMTPWRTHNTEHILRFELSSGFIITSKFCYKLILMFAAFHPSLQHCVLQRKSETLKFQEGIVESVSLGLHKESTSVFRRNVSVSGP